MTSTWTDELREIDEIRRYRDEAYLEFFRKKQDIENVKRNILQLASRTVLAQGQQLRNLIREINRLNNDVLPDMRRERKNFRGRLRYWDKKLESLELETLVSSDYFDDSDGSFVSVPDSESSDFSPQSTNSRLNPKSKFRRRKQPKQSPRSRRRKPTPKPKSKSRRRKPTPKPKSRRRKPTAKPKSKSRKHRPKSSSRKRR
jgi:hypothetical protein